jgi:hypothetical protein
MPYKNKEDRNTNSRRYYRTKRGREAHDSANKKWRDEHPEYQNNWDKEYIKRVKGELFNLLGNKCVICGYQGIALQIDHVNNNGCKERNLRKNGGHYYSRVLKKVKAGSKEYQLLCANCNWEKEMIRRESD